MMRSSERWTKFHSVQIRTQCMPDLHGFSNGKKRHVQIVRNPIVDFAMAWNFLSFLFLLHNHSLMMLTNIKMSIFHIDFVIVYKLIDVFDFYWVKNNNCSFFFGYLKRNAYEINGKKVNGFSYDLPLEYISVFFFVDVACRCCCCFILCNIPYVLCM